MDNSNSKLSKRDREKIHRHNNTFLKCFHCGKEKQYKYFIIKETGGFASGKLKKGPRKGEKTYYCPDCRTPETKLIRCITCFELKGRDEFNKDKVRPTLKQLECRECMKLWWDSYSKENRDKINAQHRAAEKRRFEENPIPTQASHMLRNAKGRVKEYNKKNPTKAEVTITKKEIEDKIRRSNNKCPMTGVAFTAKYGNGHGPNEENPWNPSLDRIDVNNPDYSNENTRVTSNIFNYARGKGKDENLERLCRAIIDQENKNTKIEEIMIEDDKITLHEFVLQRLNSIRNDRRSKGWKDLIDVDYNWFMDQIKNNKCPITGIAYEIKQDHNGVGTESDWSPSFDAIKPESGHGRKVNSRVVTTLYNRAKNVWSDEDMKKFAHAYIKKIDSMNGKNYFYGTLFD